MSMISIRGVNVNFPFSPYDCQMVYMEKVIFSFLFAGLDRGDREHRWSAIRAVSSAGTYVLPSITSSLLLSIRRSYPFQPVSYGLTCVLIRDNACRAVRGDMPLWVTQALFSLFSLFSLYDCLPIFRFAWL